MNKKSSIIFTCKAEKLQNNDATPSHKAKTKSTTIRINIYRDSSSCPFCFFSGLVVKDLSFKICSIQLAGQRDIISQTNNFSLDFWLMVSYFNRDIIVLQVRSLFFWQKNLQHEDTRKPQRTQRKIKMIIIFFLGGFVPAS